MKENLICGSVNAFQYILMMISVNEVFQYIELGLAIASTLFLLLYRVWKWYKEAKKDGKIDKEEISDLVNIFEDGEKDLKEQISKKDEIKK